MDVIYPCDIACILSESIALPLSEWVKHQGNALLTPGVN